MKMRKLLPFVLLAVGALFLLSGCDAMLDAIFPSNQISVDVWVTAYTHTDYAVGAYVSVTLHDNTSGTSKTATTTWQSYDGYYVHYRVSFTKLKDDNFSLTSTYVDYLGYTTSTFYIYDPSGYGYVGNGLNFTMPYSNSGDSTGHSITVVQYFP
jgi:hypothetical protein